MVLLIAIVVLALVFDYTNGFHDSANAIATSVSTRAISPRTAVLMAAGFNLFGALVSSKVAGTVGKGIVDTDLVTLGLVLAALVGAVVWNLTTWYFALPSSSSQALFGGLIGAMLAAVGVSGVEWSGVVDKIILPMVLSPVIGFGAAWLLMTILIWIVRKRALAPVNKTFRRLQPFSAAFMAFAHGGNDAQKTMGVITLALSRAEISSFYVPLWVKIACALAMAAGHLLRRLAHHAHVGLEGHQARPHPRVRRRDQRGDVIQIAHRLRLPCLYHAHDHRRDHGRGHHAAPYGRPLGRGRSIVFAWVLTLPAAALVAARVYLLVPADLPSAPGPLAYGARFLWLRAASTICIHSACHSSPGRPDVQSRPARRFPRRRMKIRLIEPEPPGMHVYAKVLLPRLGLPIIAATLNAHGHDVLIYNAQMAPIDWDDVNSADLVGLSSTTSTTSTAYEFADGLRAAERPGGHRRRARHVHGR